MKSFILLGFFLTLNFANAREKIVGGEPALSDGQIARTTVMIIGQLEKSQYICTGSILDKDMIVTAAHCLKAKPEKLRLVFGTETRVVDGYIRAKYDDIGLIRVHGGIPSVFQPAKLFSGSLRAGDPVIVAGFGITNAKTGSGAGTLREAEVKIESALGETEVLIDQSVGRGACHGDSGGPAYAINGNQLLLWGVISRAYSEMADDDCAHGVVYLRIAAFDSWIRQAVRKLRED